MFRHRDNNADGESYMTYHKFMMIVRFEDSEESTVFHDIVAIDKDAAHGDIENAYGKCEVVGFRQS